MDFKSKLESTRAKNNSLLCVGLDPDLPKIPKHIAELPYPYFEFCKAIVDATADLVCAFKPNSAFFEEAGAVGIEQLKQLCDYIKDTYPAIPIILDSKRADIGNTNNGYVKHSFEYLGVDAVTVHPYLGQEALEPFLSQKDKGIIVLCRTSNPGSGEFQDIVFDGKPLYLVVAQKVATEWNTNKNCLLVVGATYPEEIAEVRKTVGPEMVLLIPGVGAQGGDVEKTVKAGGENIMINSSRAILYASDGKDFAQAARKVATQTNDEVNKYR